jgi:ATP-dependent Lhr-like helicase
VLTTLAQAGALFFGELVLRTNLLPSRVEQALGELVAQGWVTADSFEGLRALLLPSEKRVSFAEANHKRRHKSVTSVEFAGRWSLLRPVPAFQHQETDPIPSPPALRKEIDPAALENLARTLLKRYGILFRRLLEREALAVSWFELGRVFRKLEAQGEIRGGHFVSGVGGEQFALPEAVGLMRSIRRSSPKNELLVISGADPLNLAGILSPGPRVTAITSSRLLLRDGVPVAALEGGKPIALESGLQQVPQDYQRALLIGTLPPSLRPYYA